MILPLPSRFGAIVQLLCLATFTTNTWANLPRGADPADSEIYVPADGHTFVCGRLAQKSGAMTNQGERLPETIPYESVNDGYCDCWDGSDEPGTSACRNSYFYCANEPYLPSRVASRFVNDGICHPDCCDGSKDFATNIKTNCPNTCYENQLNLINYLQEAVTARNEIFKEFDQFTSKSEKSLESKHQERRLLNAELESLTKESEAHNMRQKCQQKLLDQNSEQLAMEKLKKSISHSLQVYKESTMKQQDLDNLEHKINHALSPASEVEIAECANFLKGMTWEALMKKNNIPLIKRLVLSFKIVFSPKSLLKDFSITDMNNANEAQQEIATKIDKITREITELEKRLKYRLPFDEWYHLAGKCFRFRNSWNAYNFCPFDYVDRDGHVMGNWNATQSPIRSDSLWVMTNKEPCDKGPRDGGRMATIILKCGPKDELVTVNGAVPCQLELIFQTPVACAADVLDVARRRLKSYNGEL